MKYGISFGELINDDKIEQFSRTSRRKSQHNNKVEIANELGYSCKEI